MTSGTPAALAAKTATSTIPIVMGSIVEAISTGIVSSLARPGGNITGFSALNLELEGKRLELLKVLIPQLSRVGMLANAANPLLDVSLSLRSAADVLGVSLDIFEIRRTDEIDGALLKLVQARPEAVVVAADTLLLNSRREIVEALAKGNLPAIYPFREYSAVGGLLVHGANLSVLFERAAAYVDRILKGAKPGDLPVQQATEFEIIINLNRASVGRLLAQLGLTCQKPLHRALERNEALVKQWLKKEYPQIKASAHCETAEIYFGDSAHMRSDHHAGRTWGKKGETPILLSTGKRYRMSMVSAITSKGHLRFMIKERGGVNADVSIEFLKRLLVGANQKIFLIVDRGSAHTAKKTSAFIKSLNGALRLFFLPPYSPDKNPDELVWKHVKADSVGRTAIFGDKDFKSKVRSSLRSLQRNPKKVRTIFQKESLKYAA